MSITGIRAARAYVELVMNDSKFTRGLALAEAEMRAFANKCTAIGTQAFGMGAAMLTPITYAVGQFKELDDTMRLVRAVTRATAKDFQQLSDKARLLGKTTSFTSQQVADAMANLGRAGFDPRQIDQMISHVMNLSRATQTSVASTAEIVGNAIRQFGLEAKDAERIVDVMTATANNSSQTLDDIAQSMKYAAPIAKEFGLQIEETAYYIGILANQGLKSEMAGTSLRNMLIRLTGADTQKRFTEDLQVQIRDAEGRVKNIKDLLSEANAAMNAKGWDQLQRGKWLRDVFGLRAIAGGAKFLTVGDQFLNIMNAIADSEGTAARTAKQMDEGIGGAIRITISVFQELANVIGEAVSPEIIQFGKYLQDLMNGWITYLKYHREVVVEWAKLGRALAVGGALFFGIGSVIRTAGTFLGALVGSGKAVAVIWKALSRSADDSGEEMSSAGNAAKKAGSDFGEAAKQFRQAGQDMLKSGKIAVDAGKRMKEATASVTAAGKAVSGVGEQMNVPSEKFKLAAETITVAGEQIERTNTILAELGRFLRMVAVNATVAARSMEKFVKAVRAINAPMQSVTNRLGKRFEKITKSVGATVSELEKFQRQLAKLETPKDQVGDYIKKTGAAAKQAAPEVNTVASALGDVASAGAGITGTVSQMEQLTTAAANADAAVQKLATDAANIQGGQPALLDVTGFAKKRKELQKEIDAERSNLEVYYGSERERLTNEIDGWQKDIDDNPLGRKSLGRIIALQNAQAELDSNNQAEISSIMRVLNLRGQQKKIDQAYSANLNTLQDSWKRNTILPREQRNARLRSKIAELRDKQALVGMAVRSGGHDPILEEEYRVAFGEFMAQHKAQRLHPESVTSPLRSKLESQAVGFSGPSLVQQRQNMTSQMEINSTLRKDRAKWNEHKAPTYWPKNATFDQKKSDREYDARIAETQIELDKRIDALQKNGFDDDIINRDRIVKQSRDKIERLELAKLQAGALAMPLGASDSLYEGYREGIYNVAETPLSRPEKTKMFRARIDEMRSLQKRIREEGGANPELNNQYRALAESYIAERKAQRQAGQVTSKSVLGIAQPSEQASAEIYSIKETPKPVQNATIVSEGGMTTAPVQAGGYSVVTGTDVAATLSGGQAPENIELAFKKNKKESGFQIVASDAEAATKNIAILGGEAEKSGAKISHTHNTLKQSSKGISLFGIQSADATEKVKSAATSVLTLEGACESTVKPTHDVSDSISALKKSVAGTEKALTTTGRAFQFTNQSMNIVQKGVIQTERSAYALVKSAREVTEQFGDFNMATTKAAVSLDNTKEMIDKLPPTISTTGNAAQSAAKSFTYVGNAAAIFGQKVVGAIASFAKSLGSIAAFTLAIEGIAWAFKKVKEQMDFRNGKLNLSFDAQEAQKALIQSFPEDEARLKRLAEINAEHNKTNEMLAEAANLVGELTSKYDDLGIRVSLAAKEVEGLAEASETLGKAQLKKELVANKAAIKELEQDNKTIDEYVDLFEKRYLVREGANTQVYGSGETLLRPEDIGTQQVDQRDVTELLGTYGEPEKVFSLDNWKELYKEVYGEEIGNAFDNIQKPLVIKNASGGTNIVALESTAVDADQVEAYNKNREQQIKNNNEIARLTGRIEMIESGNTEIKEKPTLGTPTEYAPVSAWQNGWKDMTATEFETAYHSGELEKNITSDNYQEVLKNVDRIKDELKAEQAMLESQPILTGANNLGPLNVDEIQATLESILGAGSEDEQGERRRYLNLIADYRAELDSGNDIDYKKYEEAYEYGKRTQFKGILDAWKRDIDNIYEQVDKEFEEITLPNGVVMYHQKGTPDDELLSGGMNGQKEQRRGELAASRSAGKIAQYNNLLAAMNALSRGMQLRRNLGIQADLDNFVHTTPQNMVQSSADQIGQELEQMKRDAGIGDALEYALQDIDEKAKKTKEKADKAAEDMKKLGIAIFDNLPIDEWRQKAHKQADEYAEAKKQTIIEDDQKAKAEQAQRQEDAKKQLEQRIGSFGGQMSFINGETQDPYRATMDYIKQQHESYKTEAEAIATTAKEQGQQVNGKDADEWLAKTQHDIYLWSEVSKAQTRAAFGKGYKHKREADREANYNYNNNTTEWDYENAAIDADIAAARQRQEFARSMGNEQGAAQEEANIQNLNYEKTMNSYYKELENIDVLEKNRNQDLKAYKKTTREIDIAERKLERHRGDMTEDQIKAEEERIQAMKDEQKVQGARLEVSSAKLGQSAEFINNVEAFGNVQQTLFDVSRSFSSKGTFDAYETGGQGVATWTAEFKEQTTILGNIEDYLATMASGEYL